MAREDGEPRPGAEEAAPDSPRGRLKGYHEPFEPVPVEDWEALGLGDDTDTPGGSA